MTSIGAHGALIGIDLGGTLSKVSLFDLSGVEIAHASVSAQITSPHSRWIERDMGELWQQVVIAIREVMSQTEPSTTILAIGLCGHGDGLYLVDAALEPVRAAILASDSRAHQAASLDPNGPFALDALRATGQAPFAATPGVLLTWLREHEPASFERIRWVLSAKDWVRLRLTGEVATDPSDAAASFVDVQTQAWSIAALGLYDLEEIEGTLPPITSSSVVVGRITPRCSEETGLQEGIPVVVGSHDVDAAAIGIGAHLPGSSSVILGTFSINQVLWSTPKLDPRWQARGFAIESGWLHMSTSPAGATNLEWAVHQLGPYAGDGTPDVAAAVQEATQVKRAEDDPIYLPFLYGSPHGKNRAGSWVGMRGWHTRAHLLRAVLEGVALNHKTHMSALRESFSSSRPIRIAGGGTKSPEWCQMLSDVLAESIEVTDTNEAGARGAAMMAGVGVGVYSDIDDAVERCVRVVRAYDPEPESVVHFRLRYQRYLRAVTALAVFDEASDR